MKFYFHKLFLTVPFLALHKILRTSHWNGCSYKKGSLGRDIPRIGTLVGLLLAMTWQAASALLGLASPSSTHQPADVACTDNQTGLPIGSVLVHAYQGINLGVFRVVGPTPPQVALRGPWKEYIAVDGWHAAICLLLLGGPWKACLLPHKIRHPPTRWFL